MRNLFFALLVVSPALSFGSSTVCSSESLYYSNVRGDFGIKPPTGMAIGQTVIVFKGNVLLNHTAISGLFPHGVAPYQVQFEGEKAVLENTGHGPSGSEVFKQTLILLKVNSMTHETEEELSTESVVCKRTWKFVP